MNRSRTPAPLHVSIGSAAQFLLRCDVIAMEANEQPTKLSVVLFGGIGPRVVPVLTSHLSARGGALEITEIVGGATRLRITLPGRATGQSRHLMRSIRFAIRLNQIVTEF